MSTEIIEGLKEVGRTAVLAVIPLMIVQLQNGVLDWRAIAVAGAIAILSGIDKWMHKSNEGLKALGGDGLTGF